MPDSPVISSSANPLLKDIRRALHRGVLTSEGACVAETFHLLEEALRSPCRVRTVLAAESAAHRVEDLLRGHGDVRLQVIADRLLETTAEVVNSQGVLAMVDPPAHSLEQMLSRHALLVVIDALQDPGNLGAILRSAEAFGATGVILLKGCVSPFNSKAMRASAGSVFRVPFVQGVEESEAMEMLDGKGIDLYAAVPVSNGAIPLFDAGLTSPSALIIGNEGHGISTGLRAASRAITIPTSSVESLNAAISTAILLYEARRQRSGPPRPASL